VALGLAQGAYEHALAYAQSRHQFGRPIADFQGIRWKLADMAIKLDAARLLIHRAASTSADGFPEPLAAAKAKTFAAEMAQEVTNQALQIHGAAGYGRGLPLERMVRDARMFAIGGGTVEMMRNLIADRILPERADFRR
jgi:alkylation response protein AidB-like acyl-CoA dehydrogenase